MSCKQFRENHVAPLLAGQEDLELCGEVSKETIDYLSRQIQKIEGIVQDKVELRKPFSGLQTVPGIGKILSLTIMLETGEISRFPKVGNFSSYCRKVPTSWTSNDKKKGGGNSKNGNKYLAWAFSEAAEMARRYDTYVKGFLQQKSQQNKPDESP